MIAAIVPAAGASRRMGRPKLTLPIAGGGTVIDRVIKALREGGVDVVVVVVPPIDQPGAAELSRRVAAAAAIVVAVPSATGSMRETVTIGLDAITELPQHPDALLIAPGDSIGLSSSLVAAVIAHHRRHPNSLIVPVHDGRRGHPLALPWAIARTIPDLPPHLGLNALRDRHADLVSSLEVPEAGTAADLDTPADYLRWAPEL